MNLMKWWRPERVVDRWWETECRREHATGLAWIEGTGTVVVTDKLFGVLGLNGANIVSRGRIRERDASRRAWVFTKKEVP